MKSETTFRMGRRTTGAVGQILICLSLLVSDGSKAEQNDATQTLVFIRHGEKPDEGLGQLSCRGLNRALALGPVIARSFGRPDVIFAPNPSKSKTDAGEPYNYVRPLATVEPAAIFFKLPVNTSFGFSNIGDLQAAIEKRLLLHNGILILIAWEHKMIEASVKSLLAIHGGDPAAVPKWHGDDYDSIYVVTISTKDGRASFAHMRENLDGQATSCP